jgi:hypothetical protein
VQSPTYSETVCHAVIYWGEVEREREREREGEALGAEGVVGDTTFKGARKQGSCCGFEASQTVLLREVR